MAALRLDRARLALVALLAAGVALRVLAAASSWPAVTTIDDGYQTYAGTHPLQDPLHPGGYALLLAALGAVTRSLAAPTLLQHAMGVTAALLLAAATARLTGRAWTGLLPAAAVLLGADGVFLESTVLSEPTSILLTAAGTYAAVRAADADRGRPALAWGAGAGLALGAGVAVRTATGPLVAVVVLAVVLLPRASGRPWRAGVRPALAVAVAAGVVLLAFAGANARWRGDFGIGPSPGWYLYGRVAQVADCSRFAPPAGTRQLCERTPPAAREGASHYLFDAKAPAPRTIGPFGTDDARVGTWARRALRAQPGDAAALAWQYARGYFVPSARPARPGSGQELDPQLDWTYANPFFAGTVQRSLATFFPSPVAHRWPAGLDVLHAYQRVVRFGATALCVSTLLALLGLALGSRRERVAVLLLGGGGLSLLVAPVLTGNYLGRYTVPMAGPMLGAAAVGLLVLVRRARGSSPRGSGT